MDRATGSRPPRAAAALAALFALAALSGCGGGGPVRPVRPAPAPLAADGFPQDWELPPQKPAAPAKPPANGGFPEGWELADETATRTVTGLPVAAISATVSGDADLAKARTQVGKAGNMLGRLKASGYRMFVQDDLAAIDGLLGQAQQALGAGNAPEARRLADAAALLLQRAKGRIEAETQQPLRW